jgi:glycosyltransferase involved in cell wall biosynthesis
MVYVFQASGLLEARFRRAGGTSPADRLRSFVVDPMLSRLERDAAASAARIVVMSHYSRAILVQGQPTAAPRASIVWGGVDTAEFSPSSDRRALRSKLGISAGQTVLITVRRLVSRMGIDVLLAAVSQLRKDDPSIRLVILGDGELRPSLEAKRDALQLASHVDFMGRVSESDLKSWYQAADLFILPTVAYEGFGMVTAEALASGTPVVGTRVGATSELLEPLDPGLLATAPSASGLVTAINGVLERIGPELRAECRTYAAQHLSWGSALDRWEAALRHATEAL